MKGFNFTEADAAAHAAKHGYSLTMTPIPDPKRARLTATASEAASGTMSPAAPQAQKQATARKRGVPNKTEAAYMAWLEVEKRRGNQCVVDYQFEPLTLRWGQDPATGDQMRYTPDFLVRRFVPSGKHVVVEIKGGHIFDRDLVRFKGCRAEWGWLFDFELWQKKGGEWKRLL